MLILCKFLVPIPDVLADKPHTQLWITILEKKCGLYAGEYGSYGTVRAVPCGDGNMPCGDGIQAFWLVEQWFCDSVPRWYNSEP